MRQSAIEWFKGLFNMHHHKYVALEIYPPHNHTCKLESCKDANDYGFLVRCECGDAIPAKIGIRITEVVEVRQSKR